MFDKITATLVHEFQPAGVSVMEKGGLVVARRYQGYEKTLT